MEREQLRLLLELELGSDPVKGSLRASPTECRQFEGWMEFAAVLDAMMQPGPRPSRSGGAFEREHGR